MRSIRARSCRRALVAAWYSALALSAGSLGPSGARAEGSFAIEAFEPSPFVDDSILNVHGARTYRPRAFSLSATVSYGRNPLSIANQRTGTRLAELVGSVGTLNLMGAVGLWKRLDVGVVLPVHRVSAGSEFDQPVPAVEAVLMQSNELALGDLRLIPRASLVGEGERGFGVALLAPLYLPTGKDSVYAGEPFRIEPRIAVDWVGERRDRIALNVGYLIRNRTNVLTSAVDDMLRIGAGAEVPIAAGFSALAELNTQLNVLSTSFAKRDAPTEGLLGLRFRKAGWLGQIGGGPALVRGLTAPRYRLFASVGFSHAPPPDADRDDIADDVDRCPAQPEDKDGFEDADGCPEPDNDGDGVADALDRCKQDPEDTDGFQDEDGCPDVDNDGDGVADANDTCPDEPEDRDRFQDEDGCPENDNDGDTVADAEDQCPLTPGAPEKAGCPAPPAPPANVELTDEAIELRRPVFFEKNRAVIQPQSAELLDEVAKVLTDHPEVEHVVVEGHTDSKGSRARNRALSKQRAQAVVKALTARGVAPQRLSAIGVGPDKPIATNDTEEGRAQNRRVALRIEKTAPGQENPG